MPDTDDDSPQAIEPLSELWYNRTRMKAEPEGKRFKNKPASKKNKHILWTNGDIDILLWTSVIALGIGLFAPILTFKKLLFYKSTVSIYSVLLGLIEEKEFVLFLIIFVFSIIFPVAKNLVIAVTRYTGSGRKHRLDKYLKILGRLSKWSMLDVFLVALLVVIIQLGLFGKVEVRWGIYVFASSVILSTLTLNRLIAKRETL